MTEEDPKKKRVQRFFSAADWVTDPIGNVLESGLDAVDRRRKKRRRDKEQDGEDS